MALWLLRVRVPRETRAAAGVPGRDAEERGPRRPQSALTPGGCERACGERGAGRLRARCRHTAPRPPARPAQAPGARQG